MKDKLKFPLWLVYKHEPAAEQRIVALFRTQQAAELFRDLHKLVRPAYLSDEEALLKFLKIFEDDGYSGVQFVQDGNPCGTMMFQEIRDLLSP
jgi:hypothetical protein